MTTATPGSSPPPPPGADEPPDKSEGELAYWSGRKEAEGELLNSWYQGFYTAHFGLTAADYADLKVLDIGCGPRGSLEWADGARERVGVDPLADRYLQLGASDHKMTYVTAPAEAIPYEDGHFDIVCSFNSLDHVDDLEGAIGEIKRLTRPGGLFLLITDVHDEPTPQEPICFDWDITDRFAPELVPQSIRCWEKPVGMYASVTAAVPFDHSDAARRYGVLSARFVRMRPAEDDPADGLAEPPDGSNLGQLPRGRP